MYDLRVVIPCDNNVYEYYICKIVSSGRIFAAAKWKGVSILLLVYQKSVRFSEYISKISPFESRSTECFEQQFKCKVKVRYKKSGFAPSPKRSLVYGFDSQQKLLYAAYLSTASLCLCLLFYVLFVHVHTTVYVW